MNDTEHFIAKKLEIDVWKVKKTIELFECGGSVPFIARYRQQDIGNLASAAIYAIKYIYDECEVLSSLKSSKIKTLKTRNNVTEYARERINACTSKDELEEVWNSYKERKLNKSQRAKQIDKMEEISNDILQGKLTIFTDNMINIPPESNISLLEGLESILVDTIGHDQHNITLGDELLNNNILIHTKLSKTKKDNKANKYALYDEFEKNLNNLTSYQVYLY